MFSMAVNSQNIKKVRSFILHTLLVMASLVVLIPLAFILLGSFKNATEVKSFSFSLPNVWLINNYFNVLQSSGYIKSVFNSIFITTVTVALVLVAAAMCSFYIARRKKEVLYNYFLLGVIAPLQVITTFGLLKIMHLTGGYTAAILVFTATNLPWSVFIFSGFIKGIPKEMDEAAFIDGCGPLRMFFRIILPLLKPVVVTNLIIVAMFAWNDFMIPLYFINTSSKWPMTMTIYYFYGMYYSDWNLVFADMVLTALPIMILYLFCQKYIISGMTSGAIKS